MDLLVHLLVYCIEHSKCSEHVIFNVLLEDPLSQTPYYVAAQQRVSQHHDKLKRMYVNCRIAHTLGLKTTFVVTRHRHARRRYLEGVQTEQ